MNATVTLADVHGSIMTYTVPNAVLMAVWESLESNPDCNKVDKLALPVTEGSIEPITPNPTPTVETLTMPLVVRDGTRTGMVEIVYSSAPGKFTIDQLKARGFRFSPSRGHWWGRLINLPAEYADNITTEIIVQESEPEVEPEVQSEVDESETPAQDDAAFMQSLAGLMAS